MLAYGPLEIDAATFCLASEGALESGLRCPKRGSPTCSCFENMSHRHNRILIASRSSVYLVNQSQVLISGDRHCLPSNVATEPRAQVVCLTMEEARVDQGMTRLRLMLSATRIQ